MTQAVGARAVTDRVVDASSPIGVIAAAVTLVSIGALIAAPGVRHLERIDEPRLERSAV